MEFFILIIVIFIVSYLCGSIPFGLILTKAFNLGDLRKIGSGSIGATNVLRTGNKKIAALTLFLDALKGFIPVFIFLKFGAHEASISAIAAIIGHCYPIWLKFKGGKGVATALGILFGLNPIVALLSALTWLVCAFLTKISSLSALVACIAAPIYMFFTGNVDLALSCGLLSLIICIRHESNIKRILNKTEPKIGQK